MQGRVKSGRPGVAALLLVGVGVLLFAVTRGLEFLAGISILAIGAQAVVAINLHLLSRKGGAEPGSRSNEPFRFRLGEEVIVSGAFALAAVACFAGVLSASDFSGWLALGAAAAGAANIVSTRRSAVRDYGPPGPRL